MAIVTKAQLKSLELKTADENIKFEVTKELIRECYNLKYSREEVRVLTKFFEWVFRSSKAFGKRLKEAIKEIEEEFKMQYLASWEREAKKEGRVEGIDEEKIRTATEMLKAGYTTEAIRDITSLPEERIKELAAKSH